MSFEILKGKKTSDFPELARIVRIFDESDLQKEVPNPDRKRWDLDPEKDFQFRVINTSIWGNLFGDSTMVYDILVLAESSDGIIEDYHLYSVTGY